MKGLIFSLLIMTSSAFASEVDYTCDTLEAQVTLEVVAVETDSMMTCKAIVSAESISHYNTHALCPLDMQTVIDEGIDFPLIHGHDCEPPSTISGILVKDGNKIYVD